MSVTWSYEEIVLLKVYLRTQCTQYIYVHNVHSVDCDGKLLNKKTTDKPLGNHRWMLGHFVGLSGVV